MGDPKLVWMDIAHNIKDHWRGILLLFCLGWVLSSISGASIMSDMLEVFQSNTKQDQLYDTFSRPLIVEWWHFYANQASIFNRIIFTFCLSWIAYIWVQAGLVNAIHLQQYTWKSYLSPPTSLVLKNIGWTILMWFLFMSIMAAIWGAYGTWLGNPLDQLREDTILTHVLILIIISMYIFHLLMITKVYLLYRHWNPSHLKKIIRSQRIVAIAIIVLVITSLMNIGFVIAQSWKFPYSYVVTIIISLLKVTIIVCLYEYVHHKIYQKR